MDPDILREERLNADETLAYLRRELMRETAALAGRRESLMDINRIMTEDYGNVSLADEERMNELAQYLAQFSQGAKAAEAAAALVSKYERLLDAPYFGRFDLLERGFSGTERVYVGFYNLFDLKQGRIYIYDWRSPIASVYYRYELGECHYDAPDGKVEGEVLLKRQLKFAGGELKFYADSGLVIRDEILLETLSQNATPKMKTIVETIQKEQDQVIRDLRSGALMVNGVAGSGKTSIALHRIAYLLYENKVTGVTHKNILSLSPSDAFADYVDDVLPNLGEERIKQLTVDDIYAELKNIKVQTKNEHLESLMKAAPAARQRRLRTMAFKSSRTMAELLDRLTLLYERKLHEFSDIVLDGRLLYTRQQLRALFLDNAAKLPARARLLRIRDRVAADAEPIFDNIRTRLKKIVKTYDKWAFEEESRTDALMAKLKNRFYAALNRQFRLDVTRIYLQLPRLLPSLSRKLRLPEDVMAILKYGRRQTVKNYLPFSDAGALLYLTERLCGARNFAHVRHVVIDEAQDYGVISFLAFKRLFPNARYTILGDVNQAVGRFVHPDFFRRLSHLMKLPRTALLSLQKSYRSSMEIQEFSNRILGSTGPKQPLRQTGRPPEIIKGGRSDLINHMAAAIKSNENVLSAVLTRTAAEAAALAELLRPLIETDAFLVTAAKEKLSKRLNIMPTYMAKGLEFDFVMVWTDTASPKNPFDRSLLYVSCTRALHRLCVYVEE